MSRFIVYKDKKRIYEGTATEIAGIVGASPTTVAQAGRKLGMINGYQIVENRNITRLDDYSIIAMIDDGMTFEQIAKRINYPLPGLKQYCLDRGYKTANKGRMTKQDVYYPLDWVQCPVCKRWFKNYVGVEWHYQAPDKRGRRVYYCSYTCCKQGSHAFDEKPMRGTKYTKNF